MRSNGSVTLLLKVGVGVLFFSQQLSGGGGGEGGGGKVHWWRLRGVCAYRGSLVHNQLQWARCAARRVHGWRWRGTCASGVAVGARSAPWFALSFSRTFSLSLSLSLSLSPFLSLSLALPPSLSPSLARPLALQSDSSLSVPPSQSRDCRMFTLRRERTPTTTLSQIQGSRAPGALLIGYLLGDWQAQNDWLRTRGPPSGRFDWLLFNLGRAS